MLKRSPLKLQGNATKQLLRRLERQRVCGELQGDLRRLIERNLCRCLHVSSVLVERSIGLMTLLLDRSTKLHQLLRYWLIGGLEDIDETMYC